MTRMKRPCSSLFGKFSLPVLLFSNLCNCFFFCEP
uniref:Uncharacterized protein n=1 Tax=Anguilla anguilla TaxID=7936 RepID=A0A0E9V8R0_ANGAN